MEESCSWHRQLRHSFSAYCLAVAGLGPNTLWTWPHVPASEAAVSWGAHPFSPLSGLVTGLPANVRAAAARNLLQGQMLGSNAAADEPPTPGHAEVLLQAMQVQSVAALYPDVVPCATHICTTDSEGGSQWVSPAAGRTPLLGNPQPSPAGPLAPCSRHHSDP